MNEQINIAARYEHKIPEGYEARIEGNKVVIELKESEDERIRKAIEGIIRVYGKTQGEWIIGYDMDTLVVHLRDAFAYLEKHKGNPFSGVGFDYNGHHYGMCIRDDKPEILIDGKIQKEQKPAEWSEEDERILKEIISDYTMASKSFCGHQGKLDWFKSRCLQPQKEWTIEDAKPGDILHTSSTASSKTFIFKGIRNDEHGTVECYCCYDSEDGFRKGEEELIGWKTDRYRLATTEQCIELGRIMGRAGYIFYFETNQLRKLNEHQWKPSEEHYWQILSKKEKEDTKAIEAPSHQKRPYVDLDRATIESYSLPLLNRQVSREELDKFARHFYELGLSTMIKRLSDPEYNREVIEKIKSEYPVDESNTKKL